MIRTRLLALVIAIAAQAYGDPLSCPYGCGTNEDPDVGYVGEMLVSSLADTGFLKEILGRGDGGEGILYEHRSLGKSWALEYDVECMQEEMEDCEEDEEDPDFSPSYHHFTREKICKLGGREYVEGYATELENYLQTAELIKIILSDIELCFKETQSNNMNEIALYEKKASSSESQPDIRQYQDWISRLERGINRAKAEYVTRINRVEAAQVQIGKIYREIFDDCIAYHKTPGAFFCRGLLNFQEGWVLEAFDDVEKYVALAPTEADLTDLDFYKGIIESELGLYIEAVQSLSKFIEKNPQAKEAYFERAVAYYELGDFDCSLNDYLASDIRPHPIPTYSTDHLAVSVGLVKGLLSGGTHAGVEFIPSLLFSLQGIGHGLWVFAQDPVQVSVELVGSVNNCIDFIKESTPQEVIGTLVPELRELIEEWDHIQSDRRGEIIGFVIGKYGVDILAGSGIAKGVKAFRDLRRANHLLTFEAMAISAKNRELIQLEASRRALARQEVLRHSNLKIQWDKQGKHIASHKNYALKNKSILEHPDPQRLVNDFAGKGRRVGNVHPGTSGYQEVVDFGEFIGYAVVRETKEKIPTSWGKIHYAKDGVHVVPTKPRGP